MKNLEKDRKIILKDIKKSYKGETVLSIENLEIEQGEILAILGRNGSGKSTLIKIISGLLYQDEGTASIFSLSNRNKAVRNITKFVQESGKGYYDYLTARENIDYFLGLNKIKLKNVEDDLNDLIKKFEFEEHLDKKISELSQGNRQKLSIIVSLMTYPEILLLDEPTNGLDLVSSNFLIKNLKDIADEKGTTIILTTHDLNFVKNLNVRCLILKDGLVVADDFIDKLVDKDRTTKYKILISKEDSKALDSLNIKDIRYSYTDDSIILNVYDEDLKDLITKEINILGLYQEPLDMEDIYYRVIKNG